MRSWESSAPAGVAHAARRPTPPDTTADAAPSIPAQRTEESSRTEAPALTPPALTPLAGPPVAATPRHRAPEPAAAVVRRWTPVPEHARRVARRPKLLVPLLWLILALLVAGAAVSPLLLVVAALVCVPVCVLAWRWQSRRADARRLDELQRHLPGRHARSDD